MSFLSDRLNLGYFPLQDYAATQDGTPEDARQCLGAVRIHQMKPASQITDGDTSVIEYARDTGMGTVGDIHPWFFWQTRERNQRGMGAWAQVFASAVIEHDQDYGESKTQPIRDAWMHNDTRFKPRVSYIAAGLPELPGGSLVLTMAGTTEDMQHPVTMWADPRLVSVNNAGRAEAATLVVDLDEQGELCMGQSQVPGQGGRSARLHSLMRVVPILPGATLGMLGGFDGNVIALNYGRAGVDALGGYGAVFGPMGGAGGPTTGSGGGASGGGSSAQAQAGGQGPGGPPGDIEERGRFSHATPNGLGGFGQFGSLASNQERRPLDYGTFREKPVSGQGVALMASINGFGPLHLGAFGDKHRIGTDADGNPVNSGHISTNAYFYNNPVGDGPLDFEGTPYPRGAIKSYPGAAPVHLSWDIAAMHRHLTGNKQGRWRWWAEVPYLVPGPNTGPPTGGGNPGGGNPGGGGGGGPNTPGGPGRGPRPGPGPKPGPNGPRTGGGGTPVAGGAGTGGNGGGGGGPGSGRPGENPGGGNGKNPEEGRDQVPPRWVGRFPRTPNDPKKYWERYKGKGIWLPPWASGPFFGDNPGPWDYAPPKGRVPPGPIVDHPQTGKPGGQGNDTGGKTLPKGAGGQPQPGDSDPDGGGTVDGGGGYNPDPNAPGAPSTPGPGNPGNPTSPQICKSADSREGMANTPVPFIDAPNQTAPPHPDNSPTRLQRWGGGGREIWSGRFSQSRNKIGTRREDPRLGMGNYTGRNPWTRDPEVVPGVVDHIGATTSEARDLYQVFHPLHESFAALSFRPQLWLRRYPHFERNPQVPYEMLANDESRRPAVLSMRAWAAQNTADGEYAYTESYTSSRSRGGTADGGIMFAPPRFEGEDYFGIKSALDVENTTAAEATRSHVLATPGVSFSLGLPDLSGGLKAGGVTITQAVPAEDRALVIAQDGSELIRAYDNGSQNVIELGGGGTGAIIVPQGSTGSRPVGEAGMLRVKTGGINDILEVYDAANSVWRECSPNGTIPIADIAEGGTGASTVDGAVENLFLNISWDHLLPHDQNGNWNKTVSTGGAIYQANQASYSWCQSADIQGILVVSSDAGTSASTGAVLVHNNYIGYASTGSIFYLRVSANFTNGAKFRWGLTQTAPGATSDVTNGAYFEYDSTVSANIYACTAAGGSRTKTSTGQNISSISQAFRTFAIKTTASGFEFFDLDTSTSTPLATITTTIPTSGNKSIRGFCQSVYNGNTYRSIFLDAFGTEIATGWFPGRPS